MNFALVRSAVVLASIVTVAACRGEDPIGSDTEGTSSTTTTGDDGTSTTMPTTSGTSTAPEPETSGSSSSSTTTNDTMGFITTQTSTEESTAGPGPGPNGAECASDDECESMNCYMLPVVVGGGGICADCNEDADCVEAGTGISCSLSIASMTAACAPGDPGNQCMSDDACMDGLTCDAVLDMLGGFLPDTCGECGTTADCMDGDLCSPTFDLTMFSGQKKCVAPGSVPNGELCPEDEAEGDAACESTHCGSVTVMQIIQVPVCGECESDADCDMGTCMPGTLDMSGITGSTCQ
jgi:hypothetical protein